MQKILLTGIAMYRLLLSPFLPPCCRFYPTCSRYAGESMERHGLVTGLTLAIKRICRCHPFCAGGYDPVPEPDNAPDND